MAYAIEEMLLVLVPVMGLGAAQYIGYVALPIILLFLILAFFYSQIISNYPNGGGAYVVSAENIGRKSSMVSAAALIVDYVMTVAVSLSAATAALSAAFPYMHDYRLPVALVLLCVITLLNLRGMRESSKVFGIPTHPRSAMQNMCYLSWSELSSPSSADLPCLSLILASFR